jgi:preprotein translocase subunit SecD
MKNHYPLWKNILLVVLLLIAIVYAMPSFFGDDPAVQISASSDHAMEADLLERVKKSLVDNKLDYFAIDHKEESGILVRFRDVDTQLRARDILKSELGEKYVVALNLASRTPKWFYAIGAMPVKLGLDLRGGVHFLLAIDLEDMIKKA